MPIWLTPKPSRRCWSTTSRGCSSPTRCCTTRLAPTCRRPTPSVCCNWRLSIDFLVIEDDTYADLHPRDHTPGQSRPGSTGSSTWAVQQDTIRQPARVGFIAARPDSGRRVLDVKTLTCEQFEFNEQLVYQMLTGRALPEVCRTPDQGRIQQATARIAAHARPARPPTLL